MTTKQKAPLTIIGLKGRNLGIITAVELKPSPTGFVEVRGPNENGKSTVINAVKATLRGSNAGLDRPIQDGEDSAEIEIDLGGEYLVTKKWTDPENPSRNSLVVANGVGASFSSPQGILNALYANTADPVAFDNMDDAAKVKLVLPMVNLGIDLKESAAEEKKHFDERQFINREVKALAGTVSELEKTVGDTPPETTLSVGALSKMLEQAIEQNNAKEKAKKKYDDCLAAHAEQTKKVEELEAAMAAAQLQLTRNFAEGTQAANDLKALPEPPSVEDARERIAVAEANQEAVAAAATLEAKRTELASKQAESGKLDAVIEGIRTTRKDALAAAKFPVDGMGYDVENNRLTLKGLPFSVGSTAERLTAATRLSMAGNPRLRVMFISNGNLLDSAHKKVIADLAVAEGWQVWIELVDEVKKGPGLYIHEGVASGEIVVEGAEETP